MIITAGELLVEFVSHETGCGLAKTTNFSGPYPSGAPAIFVDQAARVGAKSAIVGCVGKDPFGDLLVKRLTADGVSTKYVKRSPDKTTGTAFVSYFDDGTRTFVFHLDGTAADEISEIPTLTASDILHVSGASLGSETIRRVIMGLVEQAKSCCKISYDPNIRPELYGDVSIRSCIDEIVEASDYLLPSVSDLKVLFPESTPEAFIKDMLARGKSAIVVKRGTHGAIGSCGNGLIIADQIKVGEVDPTGAGDCFCGTFVGLIDQDYSFDEALNAANVAGALHVSQRGPMEWNPSFQEIQNHLEIVGPTL